MPVVVPVTVTVPPSRVPVTRIDTGTTGVGVGDGAGVGVGVGVGAGVGEGSAVGVTGADGPDGNPSPATLPARTVNV